MLSSQDIKQKAREVGFDACGIAPASDLPELGFFREWLDRGFAGAMAYFARSADRRADVRRVLPTARSVIVTGTNYNTNRPVFDRMPESRSRPYRAICVGRRLSPRDLVAPRGVGGLDARTSSGPFEARSMSTPARCRSASTPVMPGSAGLARTRA